MSSPLKKRRRPPYKLVGAALIVVSTVVLGFVYLLFRGDLSPKTSLIVLSTRAGLVMDSGSKVTYNGVGIGRVAEVEKTTTNGHPEARLILDVDPTYIRSIPANVNARISATTVFGNKYVSLTSPKNPAAQRISPYDVITASSVTTEFNTLFETVVSLAEKVDPVKLDAALAAAAQGLDGLGQKFGQSIRHADEILADVNPQMARFRDDVQNVAALGDVYADASPDLWKALENAVITARTFNDQQADLDSALLAAIGIANTGADVLERGGPYLSRGAADLVPTSQLLNYYSPEILCTLRNYAEVAPKVYELFGGDNGYALHAAGTTVGAGNPFVYPDNLPRINAHGGPEGKPGCWQKITHDLWPFPYLVTDTGYNLAPYNHFELGSPLAIDYVWGRQIGEYTINP